MNLLDIILVILIFVGFVIGWKLKAINFIGILLAMGLGIWSSNHLYLYAVYKFQNPPTILGIALAWIVLFFLTAFTVLILFKILANFLEKAHLQWIDHFIGACTLTGVVIIALSIMIVIIDQSAQFFHWEPLNNSVLAPLLLKWLSIR